MDAASRAAIKTKIQPELSPRIIRYNRFSKPRLLGPSGTPGCSTHIPTAVQISLQAVCTNEGLVAENPPRGSTNADVTPRLADSLLGNPVHHLL